MASVILNGDTSGSVTISPPAVAGTQTVTLPAASGILQVSGNMPAFAAYANATQSVSNSTWTKVQINTKIFDTANCFDNTTNYRFTPNVAGYYQVNGVIRMGATTPTEYFMAIYKNGSAYTGGNDFLGTAAGGATQMVVTDLIYLNGSTDYIELYGYISAASNQQFQWGTVTYATSKFSAALVRGA